MFKINNAGTNIVIVLLLKHGLAKHSESFMNSLLLMNIPFQTNDQTFLELLIRKPAIKTPKLEVFDSDHRCTVSITPVINIKSIQGLSWKV